MRRNIKIVEKKTLRIRRLASLSAIRKELIRVYEECREAGPDSAKVQYHRALCFILGAVAQVKKDEVLDNLEKRIIELEKEKGGKS
jgi:hypothetical protein